SYTMRGFAHRKEDARIPQLEYRLSSEEVEESAKILEYLVEQYNFYSSLEAKKPISVVGRRSWINIYNRTIANASRILEKPVDVRSARTLYPLIGAKIGNFIIIGVLGRGGMGCVYLALDVSLVDSSKEELADKIFEFRKKVFPLVEKGWKTYKKHRYKSQAFEEVSDLINAYEEKNLSQDTLKLFLKIHLPMERSELNKFSKETLLFYALLLPFAKRAIKVIAPPPLLGYNKSLEDEFKKEAITLWNLSKKCRYIPHIENMGKINLDDATFLFFTMEYLSKNLEEMAEQRSKLPKKEKRAWKYLVFFWARQAAEGLRTAHLHGLVHRDIKPANLAFCFQDNVIKVIDWGLVKDTRQSKRTEHIAGTLLYMAPEQILDKEITPKTDTYALGLTIYKLLTDKLPFGLDEAKSLTDVIRLHCTLERDKGALKEARRFLKKFVSRKEANLIYNMIQPDPEKRIDISDFISFFESWFYKLVFGEISRLWS
ncbi:hypothetical protein DRZ77_02610, partial [Candidatus Woesearchaeota archaeon]